MDFTKTFDVGNLEDDLRNGKPMGFAIVSAMEGTNSWKNHMKKCNMAKVVSIGINGQKVKIDEIAREKLMLDDQAWRIDLEEMSKRMLDTNKPNVQESEGVKSQNFSAGNDVSIKIYEKQQEHNVGCMCGVTIDVNVNEVPGLKSNEYGVTSTDVGTTSEVAKGSSNTYVNSSNSGKTYSS